MTKTELLKIAKPILFNGEMVRALLDGRKTVTRRAIKNQDARFEVEDDDGCFCAGTAGFGGFIYGDVKTTECAKYNVGDILYVRETWTKISDWSDTDPQVGLFDGYIYKSEWCGDEHPKWRPSIHMPKGAARIFLRVKSVRVERLRDIDVSNCVREGVTWENYPVAWTADAKPAFIKLWNSTIKPADLPLYGWEANPWVWVYDFEKVAPK